MKKWILLGLLCFPMLALSSVREVTYSPTEVIEVKTALGVTTVVELDPSEEVLDYSVGFAQGWEVTRREHVFYLKPRDVDVGTNLLIRTRTRQYQLELQVAAGDWHDLREVKQAGVAYRVAVKLPAPATPVAAVEEIPSSLQQAQALAYAYSIRASKAIPVKQRPVLVFDDGKQTTLRFSSDAMPRHVIVFARLGLSDEPFLVNKSVNADEVIVHGVYPYLLLKFGPHEMQIRKEER